MCVVAISAATARCFLLAGAIVVNASGVFAAALDDASVSVLIKVTEKGPAVAIVQDVR